MNHNGYIDRLAAGRIRLAVDPDKRRYVLQTRKWDSNTGEEVAPEKDTLSLVELEQRKLGLEEALRQVKRMIVDLNGYAKENPLPELPAVEPE